MQHFENCKCSINVSSYYYFIEPAFNSSAQGNPSFRPTLWEVYKSLPVSGLPSRADNAEQNDLE